MYDRNWREIVPHLLVIFFPRSRIVDNVIVFGLATFQLLRGRRQCSTTALVWQLISCGAALGSCKCPAYWNAIVIYFQRIRRSFIGWFKRTRYPQVLFLFSFCAAGWLRCSGVLLPFLSGLCELVCVCVCLCEVVVMYLTIVTLQNHTLSGELLNTPSVAFCHLCQKWESTLYSQWWRTDDMRQEALYHWLSLLGAIFVFAFEGRSRLEVEQGEPD